MHNKRLSSGNIRESQMCVPRMPRMELSHVLLPERVEPDVHLDAPGVRGLQQVLQRVVVRVGGLALH